MPCTAPWGQLAGPVARARGRGDPDGRSSTGLVRRAVRGGVPPGSGLPRAGVCRGPGGAGSGHEIGARTSACARPCSRLARRVEVVRGGLLTGEKALPRFAGEKQVGCSPVGTTPAMILLWEGSDARWPGDVPGAPMQGSGTGRGVGRRGRRVHEVRGAYVHGM